VGWRCAWSRLERWCREDGVRCVVYGVWLALLLSAPNWLPAIRVYWSGVRLTVNSNTPVVFLGYEYFKGVLKLRFYRSFAWPSTFLWR